MAKKGYIALQDHGSKIWFRNIKIRHIGEDGVGSWEKFIRKLLPLIWNRSDWSMIQEREQITFVAAISS